MQGALSYLGWHLGSSRLTLPWNGRGYACRGRQPPFLPPFICTDATLPLMLDAVAGFIVKRIRARHVNAVAKPRDVAAILRAYTTLKHKWGGAGGAGEGEEN